MSSGLWLQSLLKIILWSQFLESSPLFFDTPYPENLWRKPNSELQNMIFGTPGVRISGT